MTREKYLLRCSGNATPDPLTFEQYCLLDFPKETLPQCAVNVLDGKTPSSDYYGWLIKRADEETEREEREQNATA